MKTIVGMFESRSEAEDAIRALEESGFSIDAIGVAMADAGEIAGVTANTGTHDMTAAGAGVGVLSGAGVGTLVGIALVGSHFVLPGLGPVLIGGPLMAALTGAGIGAASGGIIGALIGAGVPASDAEHYVRGLHEGQILVSVQADDRNEIRARQIFLQEGARVR
jgi:hypothetical protein